MLERSQMEPSSLSFDSRERRVCCGCLEAKQSSALLKCASCQVFVYCNKACQLKGWKELSHKSTCKPRAAAVATASEQIEGLPRDADDPEDLDRPYAWIQIATSAQYPDKASFLACSSGSDDDTVVAELLRGESDACAALAKCFSWPSGIPGKIGVPGYCTEWDKTALHCYADDNYRNEGVLRAAEHLNPIASYAVMISPEAPSAVRGPAIFFCVDEGNKLVKITRRDILSLANKNQLHGSDNCLSDRVHFENMRRAAFLAGLKKQNFEFRSISLD